MHKPTIHPDVIRRGNERRGRLRVFDSLRPERGAHIVVDLQDGFMAPSQVAEIATGHAIRLMCWPQDLRLPKRRFGAFSPGSSDLYAILQERNIDMLIVTGTATQVCCESTARDAMMLNYQVFFIADGNATFNDDELNATLSMAQAFCDVIDTDAMVGMIERGRAEAVMA